MKPTGPDIKNLFVAMLISMGIIMAWQHFYARPKIEALKKIEAEQKQQEALGIKKPDALQVQKQNRDELIASVARVKISTPSLHGSIALKGARIDDLTLAKYRTTIDKQSPEEILLSPSGVEHAYFAQFGWSSGDTNLALPTHETLWTADRNELTPATPVTLSWDNGQGVTFKLIYTLDDQYMFTVEQRVENHSATAVNVVPYAFLNRSFHQLNAANLYLHEGPLGVMEGSLTEIDYKDLMEDGDQKFDNAKGWVGITDKYWLTALVPDNSEPFKANFTYYKPQSGGERYQVEFLGQSKTVATAATAASTHRFFAGAKELKLLDGYAEQYNIPLFDRAVDLGVLYFITKPLFITLNYFYKLLGNFGLGILLLTVIIKLAMFPLANKSYKSMNDMKRLQPEMLKLRDRFADDKVKMNQEIMALYKREKVNPASGCLPLLLQIPIFIALYKVLFVTIEMRHAPFYGWIHDLSAPDPTNLFTAFGLLPWNAPAFLHIGIWPFVMFLTMVIQQKMNPKPTDETQAKMMAAMPYVFVFLFAAAPAGLVIYWAWSNMLSILQQYVLKRDEKGKTPAQKSAR